MSLSPPIKPFLIYKTAVGLLIALALNSFAVGQDSFSTYANAAMARLSFPGDCPAGTFNEGVGSASICAKVVGRPVCRQSGWMLNEQGMCIPAPVAAQPAVCESGEPSILPVGLSCVVQYESIGYGEPLPSRYKQCMTGGWGNNRMISSGEWCMQSIEDRGAQVTGEEIRQCVSSGAGNGHPMAPEAYCQKLASEVWGSPGYAGLNQIWVPKQ